MWSQNYATEILHCYAATRVKTTQYHVMILDTTRKIHISIQKEKKKTENQETNQRDQGKGKSVEKYVAPPTGDATRQFKISELKKQHHLVQHQHYIV